MRTVLVHGGVSAHRREPHSLTGAVEAGMAALGALDAVEEAVVRLEDDGFLNAGYGSVLARDGSLEMDAGIADGATGRLGAVTNVTVRNPVRLARRVLASTPHVLLAGRGAMELGRDMPTLDETTAAQQERWEKARVDGTLGDDYGAHDTVGAIALDASGHLAAASSTGGVFAKMPGRVGDAPIFGAGFYASRTAAVVGTGIGELFIATLAAYRTAVLIEDGAHPQEAVEEVLAVIAWRGPGVAGLLALDAEGNRGAAYRGGSMLVAGPEGDLDITRVE